MTERQPSTKAVDIVAILRSDTMEQVVPLARPMAAAVIPVADLMRQPLEDGSTVVDHIVFQPIRIDLPLVISGPELVGTFNALRDLYDAATLLVVQTRTGTYPDMVISEMPHDESPEAFDSVAVQVRFEEAKFVKAMFGGLAPAQVKDPAKASTVKKGAAQPTVTPAPADAKAKTEYKGSTLYRWTRPNG